MYILTIGTMTDSNRSRDDFGGRRYSDSYNTGDSFSESERRYNDKNTVIDLNMSTDMIIETR